MTMNEATEGSRFLQRLHPMQPVLSGRVALKQMAASRVIGMRVQRSARFVPASSSSNLLNPDRVQLGLGVDILRERQNRRDRNDDRPRPAAEPTV